MNADFISAIQELGKEKGIEPELLYQAVEDALVAAYKKNSNTNQNVEWIGIRKQVKFMYMHNAL